MVLIGVWAGALSAFAAPDTLPANTELSVRLRTPLSTRTAKSGDPVEAVVIAPLVTTPAVLPGDVVRGTVTQAVAAAPNRRAVLFLHFTSIECNKAVRAL